MDPGGGVCRDMVMDRCERCTHGPFVVPPRDRVRGDRSQRTAVKYLLPMKLFSLMESKLLRLIAGTSSGSNFYPPPPWTTPPRAALCLGNEQGGTSPSTLLRSRGSSWRARLLVGVRATPPGLPTPIRCVRGLCHAARLWGGLGHCRVTLGVPSFLALGDSAGPPVSRAFTPSSAHRSPLLDPLFSGEGFPVHTHRYLQVPLTQARREEVFRTPYASAVPQFVQLFKHWGPLKWSNTHFYLKKHFSL